MKSICTAIDAWKEKRKLSAKSKNAGEKKPGKLSSFTDTTGTNGKRLLKVKTMKIKI